MTDDPTPQAQRDMEALNGGLDVAVTFNGGAEGELVKVRKLPIRQMSLLGSVWAKEDKEIALYVQRQGTLKVDDAWLDSLDEKSWQTLIEEGRRINFTRFGAYLRRHKQAMKTMGADIDEITEKLILAQA